MIDNTGELVMALISIISALIVIFSQCFCKKIQRNPYILLIVGLVAVELILSIHLVNSYFQVHGNSSLMCQIDAMFSIFSVFTAAFYNFFLANLILKVTKEYNPSSNNGNQFHLLSIACGITATLIALILEDINITPFGTCGTASGSMHQILYGLVVFMLWPYLFYSLAIIFHKFKTRCLSRSQKELFLSHFANVVIFTIAWMPFFIISFMSFALKTVPNPDSFFLQYTEIALASTGFLNSIVRISQDTYLRKIIRTKICCRKGEDGVDYQGICCAASSTTDSIYSTYSLSDKKGTSNEHKEEQKQLKMSEGIAAKEIFSNIVATYSAICLMINKVYTEYYTNKEFAVEVDRISSKHTKISESALAWKAKENFSFKLMPKKARKKFLFKEAENLDLDFSATEYAAPVFQNLRTIASMNQEQLYNSLSPANNRVQLLKSFEKTSGKGGKPLIKTHDKKFLIKELSKSEKDLMIEILSKYRENLDKNPKSILARIYGVFSFKIKEKKKVFHVLMENLDPFDDDFCLFKYDLKFSSINRMELKFDEVETIQQHLSILDAKNAELFHTQKSAVHEEGVSRITQSKMKQMSSKNFNFMNSKQGFTFKTLSPNTHTSQVHPISEDNHHDYFSISSHDDPRGISMLRGSSFVSHKWAQIQKIKNKLKLLKDEDFKRIHKFLPVTPKQKDLLDEFLHTIRRDVKFLEQQGIMDYSLFLVVAKAPPNLSASTLIQKSRIRASSVDSLMKEGGNDDETEFYKSQISTQDPQETSYLTQIETLIASNKFVFYSPNDHFLYIFGMIDYLQRFNVKKRGEQFGKTIIAYLQKERTDFSSKPPDEFAERFLEKIQGLFSVQKPTTLINQVS